MMNLGIAFLLVTKLSVIMGADSPQAVISMGNCPVGPGVHMGLITMGTIATCKCEVKNNGFYTAQARWFTKQGAIVGIENRFDQSSTLTVWFNSSDPDQKYECRVISVVGSYNTITFTPLFLNPSCYIIVEKGQSANIRITVPRTVSSLTWQVFSGHAYKNISTCFQGLLCTNDGISRYQGRLLTYNVSTYASQLNISGATINETDFRCLNNQGQVLGICTLEVYVWPTKPVCQPVTIDSTNLFVELTCTVANVFPSIRASILISLLNPTHSVPDVNNSICNVSDIGTGLYGDVSETCTWRFPIAGKKPGLYRYYLRVKADLYDYTTVTRAAVESETVMFTMKLPVAVISDCPLGPGVRNGHIRFDSYATCRCHLNPVGFPPGQARWFTSSGQVVGKEDQSDGSSTLTVYYQASEKNQTYACRPITTLPGATAAATFTPLFTSSARGSLLKPQSTPIQLIVAILTQFLYYLVIITL